MRQHEIEYGDRQQQRPCDIAKRLPGGCAVDPGSLVQLVWNVLKTGQEDNHVETEPLPDIDHDQRIEGEPCAAEPVLAEPPELEGIQYPVEQPKIIVG